MNTCSEEGVRWIEKVIYHYRIFDGLNRDNQVGVYENPPQKGWPWAQADPKISENILRYIECKRTNHVHEVQCEPVWAFTTCSPINSLQEALHAAPDVDENLLPSLRLFSNTFSISYIHWSKTFEVIISQQDQQHLSISSHYIVRIPNMN